MNDVVEVNCFIDKNSDGQSFTLRPRTGLDKATLNSFLDNRGRLISVRLLKKALPKSYDQTKAFHALAALHFRLFNGNAPTSIEMDWWKNDCLEPMLFPVRPDFANEGKFVHKRWHELTKEEGIEVISKMLQLIAEQIDCPADIAASCKDIFEWVTEQKKEMSKENDNMNSVLDGLKNAEGSL